MQKVFFILFSIAVNSTSGQGLFRTIQEANETHDIPSDISHIYEYGYESLNINDTQADTTIVINGQNIEFYLSEINFIDFTTPKQKKIFSKKYLDNTVDSTIMIFDSTNHLIFKRIWNDDGEQTLSHKFNNHGRVVKIQMQRLNMDSLPRQLMCEYYKDTKEVKSIISNLGFSFEVESHRAHDTILYTQHLKLPLDLNSYNPRDSSTFDLRISKTKLVTDSLGNQFSYRVDYPTERSNRTIETYKSYDENGSELSGKRFRNGKKIVHEIKSYQNNKLKESYSPIYDTKVTYAYTVKGLLDSIIRSDGIISFKYDQKGNMIRKLDKSKYGYIWLTERHITYK